MNGFMKLLQSDGSTGNGIFDKRQSAVKQPQTVMLFIHIAELKAVSEFLKSLLYLKSL